MIDWLKKAPQHRRLLLVFWSLNSVMVLVLVAFATRGLV